MSRCFVVQPFNDRFTKRFHGTFAPAIKSAGLEAYRVDYDLSVDVPITAIEEGIRDSSVVLADITLDNPNVWHELGYAFALNKPIVMICSDERIEPRYPFDIQHRTIVRYSTESAQDFEALQKTLTNKLHAILQKSSTLEALAGQDDVAPVEGLTQIELALLAITAGSATNLDDTTSLFSLKSDMERAGFTSIAFTLALKRLGDKDFLITFESADNYGDQYTAAALTTAAWAWIEANEDKFVLRKKSEPVPDDEIPF